MYRYSSATDGKYMTNSTALSPIHSQLTRVGLHMFGWRCCYVFDQAPILISKAARALSLSSCNNT